MNVWSLVLDAGKDTLNITWTLSSIGSKREAEFKIIKVKLCYAPPSQVDRPWRKTHDELFKDKTCPHKIIAKPYDKTLQSTTWTLERDIPTGTYFVRAYAVDAIGHEVAYGQSTDDAKKTNLFSVQAISGRHASLDIASICFSVFSVVALVVFFVNEKRKAKIEQSKWVVYFAYLWRWTQKKLTLNFLVYQFLLSCCTLLLSYMLLFMCLYN